MNKKTGITISDSAAKHIAAVKEKKNNDSLLFRITIDSGGCSGFEYQFSFDENRDDDDIIIEADYGVTVITDPASMKWLNGATLNFINSMIGARFEVDNPNAASSCGCGTSFAPDFSKVE